VEEDLVKRLPLERLTAARYLSRFERALRRCCTNQLFVLFAAPWLQDVMENSIRATKPFG
jgi:hypothetical protein